MRVGIRDLKLHLSKYLASVRRGETVVITDRGVPVARMERLQPDVLPAAVADLTNAGLLTYKPPPRNLPAPVRMLPGEKTSTDYVAEQRR